MFQTHKTIKKSKKNQQKSWLSTFATHIRTLYISILLFGIFKSGPNLGGSWPKLRHGGQQNRIQTPLPWWSPRCCEWKRGWPKNRVSLRISRELKHKLVVFGCSKELCPNFTESNPSMGRFRDSQGWQNTKNWSVLVGILKKWPLWAKKLMNLWIAMEEKLSKIDRQMIFIGSGWATEMKSSSQNGSSSPSPKFWGCKYEKNEYWNPYLSSPSTAFLVTIELWLYKWHTAISVNS